MHSANSSELIVHWGKDFYEFKEDDLFTEVELVTDSDIEVNISIQGYPMQIPDGSHNYIPPLIVSGPLIPGNAKQQCAFIVHVVR